MADGRDQYINSVNLNAETDFPYLLMEIINDQSYPRNPGFHVMHWHEDVQFIYVLDGEIAVRTLESRTSVRPGQAIFINKNIVHMVEHDAPCHYFSFVFPDAFLRFYAGSPASGLVDRISGNSSLPVFLFSEEMPWCPEIFLQLKALIRLKKENAETEEYYPYEVLVRLSALWLVFQKNLPVTDTKEPNALNARMKAFLQYIESHYTEEVTLGQLADCASVSVSECTRCFKKAAAITPYRYLMEYRLARASELLRGTDRPVSVIALDCGFRQASHFGKLFREKTGYTPREYRRINSA